MKKIALVTSCLIVIIDQITKFYIASTMEAYDSITIIPKFFYITFVKNDGAAWSILNGQMIFFYIITLVAVAVLIYYFIKTDKTKKLQIASIALMLAGAVGNFIDRVRFQYVVDFLNFYPFGYDFPVFNVADISLTIGVGLLIIDVIMDYTKGEKK